MFGDVNFRDRRVPRVPDDTHSEGRYIEQILGPILDTILHLELFLQVL
jgi:hypothetical protein